jgi:hypothetical protein
MIRFKKQTVNNTVFWDTTLYQLVKQWTFQTKSLPPDFTDIWLKIGHILPHHTTLRP